MQYTRSLEVCRQNWWTCPFYHVLRPKTSHVTDTGQRALQSDAAKATAPTRVGIQQDLLFVSELSKKLFPLSKNKSDVL